MKLSYELKRLIYQYKNVIIVESKSIEDIVKEIESVRSGSSLKGFIFRPNFANSTKFKEYSKEDWYAIYAQWSVTFGWDNIFEYITEDNPKQVLNNYFKDSVGGDLTPLVKEEITPKVKNIEFVTTFVKSLVESKSVLNSHEMDIISQTPAKILQGVYESSTITIREIRTVVVSILIKANQKFRIFNSISDIIPIVVDLYAIEGTFDNEKITRTSLIPVKVRIPQSIKREIIATLISGYKTKAGVDNFKKYQGFWKKLLRQTLIKNSFNKTVKQYPEFKAVHSLIYSNIKTNNSKIEALRKSGLLEEAFKLEMGNIGQLLRNIVFYLRYEKGDFYAKKENRSPIMQIPVKTDVRNVLNSEEFKNKLLTANPKLLLQVKSLLESTQMNKEVSDKFMNKMLVKYSTPLASIIPEWRDSLLSLIDDSYKTIKKEENKKLGKVYISKHFKKIRMNYSGRMDNNKVKSGSYLPIGSKIKLDLNKDSLIRYGVSWKSREENPISICIDPSVTFLNGTYQDQIVDWENPTLSKAANSSGDITACNTHRWSTELMDLSVKKLKKEKSTKFFTAVMNYHAPKGDLSNVDTHIFFNIIDKKDRIIDGREIEISLDQMDYSYEITDEVQAQIGLMFDLDKGTVEVLKLPIAQIKTSSTANRLRDSLKELIANKVDTPFIYNSLKSSLYHSQITQNIHEADTVINQDTDVSVINNILF